MQVRPPYGKSVEHFLASVIVYYQATIRNKHGAKAGYGERNLSHSQVVFLDSHRIKIFAAFAFPFTLENVLLLTMQSRLSCKRDACEGNYLRRWIEYICKWSQVIIKVPIKQTQVGKGMPLNFFPCTLNSMACP